MPAPVDVARLVPLSSSGDGLAIKLHSTEAGNWDPVNNTDEQTEWQWQAMRERRGMRVRIPMTH